MSQIQVDLPEPRSEELRELTSIGAGHGADALASLVSRPCRMEVPRMRALSDASPTGARELAEGAAAGVVFDVEGGPGGLLVLLFEAPVRDRLVETLVGCPASEVPEEAAASALAELGNILASRVVSAMADLLGTAIRPSPPILATRQASASLARCLGERGFAAGSPVFETELYDADERYRSVLLYLPAP